MADHHRGAGKMSEHFNNGWVTLYQADARSLPLSDESAHCVVTSPLPQFGLEDTSVIQCLDLFKDALAGCDLFWPDSPTMDANLFMPSRDDCVFYGFAGSPFRFQPAQLYEQVSLCGLDAEIGPQSAHSGMGDSICCLPRVQGLTSLSVWFLDRTGSAEGLVEHVNNSGNNLFDPNSLREYRVACIARNPLMISAPFDREITIRIHDAS